MLRVAADYMPVVIAEEAEKGATGIGLIGSIAGVPMPEEMFEVEPAMDAIDPIPVIDEPIVGIDIPLDGLMPPMVGMGLIVGGMGLAGVGVAAGPPTPEVGVGLGSRAKEMLIPGGICEMPLRTTFGEVEPDRPGIIGIVPPPPAVPVVLLAGADDPPPTDTTPTGAWMPRCALASAVKSLRRAATLIPLRSSWTRCVNWVLVGFVWRIDANRLVTSLPALVSAGLRATSAAWALPPAAESRTRSSRLEALSDNDGMQRRRRRQAGSSARRKNLSNARNML